MCQQKALPMRNVNFISRATSVAAPLKLTNYV